MGRTRATEHIAKTTPAIDNERLTALQDLLPEAFTEEHLDLEKLQAVLGTHTASGPERYSFSWAGKRDAITALQTPSDATLTPDKKHSIKFDTTRNVFIEGDNLEVLKLLYKPYFGRVKMIYIDPPYNTGNDFVYPDDYKHPIDTYLRLTGQKKEDGSFTTSNPETSGRYHSAWLSMMYPRLFLARQLLTEDGVIFVSIDDHEVHHLRLLLNEIFGEENFIASIIWQKKQSPQNDATNISAMHDYIVAFARRAKQNKNDKTGWDRQLLPRGDEQEQRYANPDADPRGDWTSVDYTCNKTADERPNLYYPIRNPHTKKDVLPSRQRVWRFEKTTHAKNESEDRIWWGPGGKGFPRLKRFRHEVQDGIVPVTWWDREFAGDNQQSRRELRALFPDLEDAFDTPKPVKLLKRLLQLGTSPDAQPLVLDFFAGSGTTAQAVLELNRQDGGDRRFVLVQLPEPLPTPATLSDGTKVATIADVCRERVRRCVLHLNAEKQTKLGNDQVEDLGFRAFRLTASNYKAFDDRPQTTVERFTERLAEVIDPLRPGWKPEPVIYEVALKEGLGLSLNVERVDGEPEVYRVTDPDKDQSFLVCLDDKVSLSSLKPLGLKKTDLFICRDTALDDTTAANLALQCRLKTI